MKSSVCTGNRRDSVILHMRNAKQSNWVWSASVCKPTDDERKRETHRKPIEFLARLRFTAKRVHNKDNSYRVKCGLSRMPRISVCEREMSCKQANARARARHRAQFWALALTVNHIHRHRHAHTDVHTHTHVHRRAGDGRKSAGWLRYVWYWCVPVTMIPVLNINRLFDVLGC